MKGSVAFMFRRFGILVLVATIALTLGCARKKSNTQPQYGQGVCDDPSLGQFDVYTIPVPGQPGMNQISIIPVALTANGDIMRITAANAGLQYKPLLNEVSLYVDSEIVAGYLSDNELQAYDKLVISPFEPGQPFLSDNIPEKSAICQLPLPGQVTQLN